MRIFFLNFDCGDTKIIKIYTINVNRKRDSGIYHFLFYYKFVFSRLTIAYSVCDETEIKKIK